MRSHIYIFFWVFLNIHNILLLILNLRVCVYVCVGVSSGYNLVFECGFKKCA